MYNSWLLAVRRVKLLFYSNLKAVSEDYEYSSGHCVGSW